jgi:hypothetical protein
MWYVGNLGKKWARTSQVVDLVAPLLQSSIPPRSVLARAPPLTANNVNAEVLPYSEHPIPFSVALPAARLP